MAAMDLHLPAMKGGLATATWAPPRPKLSAKVDFAQLDTCEVRIYEDLGGAELRGAIELVSPSNKDRPGSRRTFAAQVRGLSQAWHRRCHH